MRPPSDLNAAFRHLPKVDDVLKAPSLRELLEQAPRWAVREAVRGEIARLRSELLAGAGAPVPLEVDVERVRRSALERVRPSLRPLVNATGVVLHTNLGRAPLPEASLARLEAVCRGYANLEYRLDERRRGSRHDHVRALLSGLCGVEDALVVNNGAAAVLLALQALACGREVIVSRGELVEIGGSFRMPDVMRAAGAKLVEVGTTNRTHLRDYARALDEHPTAALLLKVHRSNFALTGFTAEVGPRELAELGRGRGVLTAMDLGSGALVELRALGIDPGPAEEPSVPRLMTSGVDLCTFSGDKLLGGPQAGILVGRAQVVEACRTHPLMRALRPSKLTLAALEPLLELYRDGRAAEVPVLRMLAASEAELEARARALAARLTGAVPTAGFDPVRVRSAVGGGALPQAEPWSWAVAVQDPARAADEWDTHLRSGDPPVVGRITDGRLLLDVRTLSEHDQGDVVRAFSRVT